MSEVHRTRLERRSFLRGLGLTAGVGLLAPLLQACGQAATPTPTAPAAPATQTTAPTSAAGASPTQAPANSTEAPTKAPAAAGSQPSSGLGWVQRTINGGNTVSLTAWDWHQPRIDIWNAWFEEYGKLQQNVKIEITQVPYAEYLTKLQAGIPAGQAPDMFYFHNNFHTQLVDTQLVDPLPDDLFPRNVLNANFLGMKEGYFHDAKNREPRYLVTGVMSGGIYYNKDLWAKAGLTEADLPKTWDDVAEKAKLLTETDSSGRINVAGFAFNGAISSMFGYLRYQTGEFTYSPDGTKVRYDTEGMRRSLRYILDLYDVHKVK